MHLDPTPRPWANLVFHVLAHVRGSAGLAASVFDSTYVAWAASHLGPAAERALCVDAEALGRLAPSHELLARTQLLAWLFRDVERASAVAAKDLDQLEKEDVDAPELLASLRRTGAPVELLRCAAELERDVHRALPDVPVRWERLQNELERLGPVAPGLSKARVALVLSLARRGRVVGDEIWIGVPCVELGVSEAHGAWQAAHEATVVEVSKRVRAEASPLDERAIEGLAVVVLAERAARGGLAAEHARWLSHFGENAPPVARAALGAAELGLLARLVGR